MPPWKSKIPSRKRKLPKSMADVDERFAEVLTDPRFRTLKRNQRKVKVDSRFKKMFTDKQFRLKGHLDIRGGPTKPEAEDLTKIYDLSDDDDDGDDGGIERKARIPDARGLDDDELLSSSSDESDDEDGTVEGIDHKWAELDKDVPREDKVSSRLAVCNVDWDRIKAADLYILFNSFKPDSGSIISVKVYVSEFGKKRMTDEEAHGPTEIVKETPKLQEGIEHDEADAEMDEFMTEKLRQYQLNRLKYFYAIVECDSEATASRLYDELDGYEYESSASTLDVRFIPEDMTFDDEPSQECSALPDLAMYKAPIFITTALQQSKVNLTWDENDQSRKEKIEQAFTTKDEKALDDLEAFLASGSESEDDSDEEEVQVDEVKKTKNVADKINKYKLLLQNLDEEEDKEENEIEINFDDDGKEVEEDMDDSSDGDEDTDGSSDHQPEAELPKPAKKRKEGKKRKADKEDSDNPELGLLVMDEEDVGRSHFNYKNVVDAASSKTKKKKLASKMEDDKFAFQADDPRFNKIFVAPDYNIDPSDPHFKKTPAMDQLIEKKAKGGQRLPMQEATTSPSASDKRPSLNPALSSMIASIKSNTKRLSVRQKTNQ